MLPSIALVHSIEMVRDGGSLAAVFQGGDGAEYWLLFEVELRELASGEVVRLGYQHPVVVERQVGTQVEVSWEHSCVLLSQMRSLIRHEEHRKWLEAMLTAAETLGQVPPGVDRVFGEPHAR